MVGFSVISVGTKTDIKANVFTHWVWTLLYQLGFRVLRLPRKTVRRVRTLFMCRFAR